MADCVDLNVNRESIGKDSSEIDNSGVPLNGIVRSVANEIRVSVKSERSVVDSVSRDMTPALQHCHGNGSICQDKERSKSKSRSRSRSSGEINVYLDHTNNTTNFDQNGRHPRVNSFDSQALRAAREICHLQQPSRDFDLNLNKDCSGRNCKFQSGRTAKLDLDLSHFADDGFSDTSLSSEDDEDGHKRAVDWLKNRIDLDFLLSSSLSSLSDDQDLARSLELTADNMSDQFALSSDDTELYNDWDPGLNNYENNHSHGDSNPEVFDSESEIEHIPELNLPFPHRARHMMECEICLKMSYLRRRVCCDFQICNKCLSTYITLKVKEGKVQLECPNDRCDVLIFRSEIHFRLSTDMREKFMKYLIDANADPFIKTCPSCSLKYEIDPEFLNISKRKRKYGVKVTCSHCKLVWCYPCQAPFHPNITCKKYKKEDEMVKRWAKEKTDGQANAQKCPKCKIFIQKKDGCDHMQCSHCNTDFCYRCGGRYISIKLLGNHCSRFSLFGCKYRLLPQKPTLRRIIRGTNFGARLIGAVVLAGLGVAAGAVLLGASVFILPGYGIFRLRRNMWIRKKRAQFLRNEMMMLETAQREKELLNCRGVLYFDANGYMSTIPEESETETSNPTTDPQQIQVLVHRSVSFNKDDTEEQAKDCDILVNKYISDGTEVFISRSGDETTVVEGIKDDDIVTVTDVQEAKNETGYSAVVYNIISKLSQTNPTDTEADENLNVSNSGTNNEVLEAELDIRNSELPSDKMDKHAVNGILANIHQTSYDVQPNNSQDEQLASNEDEPVESAVKKPESQANESELDDTLPCQVDKKHCRESGGKLKEKEEKLKEKEEKFKEKEEKLKDREERLKEKEEKSKDKEEKPKEKEVSSHISKSNNNQEKVAISEVTADKTANNGCFGNIFSSSKRAGSPNISYQESFSKNDSKPSKVKDIFNVKAATWEKCHKTNVEVENMSKASFDLSTDLKQLPYYIQKSPSSLSSIISFSYGTEEEGKAKGSEPAIATRSKIKMEIPPESVTKSTGEEHPYLEDDTSVESVYVSQCNLVAYL